MNFFTFDIRKVFLIIMLIVLPLLAINAQRKSSEELWFTKPFTWTAGSVQQSFSYISSGVHSTTELYLNLINIKVENRTLQQENAELRAQLGAMTELKLENERLAKLLSFKQATKMQIMAAHIVGKDFLPDHQTLTINRGLNDGIRKNMAAITTAGVVGYVFRTDANTSQILVLTDRYAAIDSLVQRSRARGIVEGAGQDKAVMRYLKRFDDVRVGDLIVTSGLYNLFPKGFPVGTVTSVETGEYGMTQDVSIKPVVNPSSLEELFIVMNTNKEEFQMSNEQNPNSAPGTGISNGAAPGTTTTNTGTETPQ